MDRSQTGLWASGVPPILGYMDQAREIELVFAPQEGGGYHVYAPDLPGLHTQGNTLDEAIANAHEALELYVEGLREDGRSLDAGVIRRKFLVPA
jgi:predicted RNase H-like HicB family nuclease